MKTIRLPRTFAEWQAAGPQLAELERVVNSLLNMEGTMRLPDGNTMKGTMLMSGQNAVLSFQPFGNGGASVQANASITTAPPILNQQSTIVTRTVAQISPVIS